MVRSESKPSEQEQQFTLHHKWTQSLETPDGEPFFVSGMILPGKSDMIVVIENIQAKSGDQMEGDQMEGVMASKVKKSDGLFTQGWTIDPVPKATPIWQHTAISLPSIGIKKKKNSLLDAIMESSPHQLMMMIVLSRTHYLLIDVI
jgi:hypothetical protein